MTRACRVSRLGVASIGLSALIVTSLALALAACAMPEAPRRTALIYGVSNYVEQWNGYSYDNPNLSLTDNDARDMDAALSAKGWTTRTRIAVSTDSIVNAQAGKAQIRADIAALAGTEGLVLFYYSGHGTTYGGESAICPYGSIVPNASWTNYSLNPQAFIRSSELYAMFEAAGLKNVIVILDSCNSGGFAEPGATVDAVPPVFGENDRDGDIAYTWFVDSMGDAVVSYLAYSAGSRYVTLSAAGAGESSWESPRIGHGIFTYMVLMASDDAQADMNGDGYVSSSELYAYCAAGIDATWNKDNADQVEGDQYRDYYPHLSGTAREYALWAVE